MRGGGGARSSGPWDGGGGGGLQKNFFQPFRLQFGLKIRGYQGPSLDPSLVCELWWVDLRTKHSRRSVEEDCSKNNLPSIARNVKSHCLVFMFKMSVSHFKVYRICNINSKALILCGVSSCCENYCWFTFVFGTWVLFRVFFNLLYYIYFGDCIQLQHQKTTNLLHINIFHFGLLVKSTGANREQNNN